MITVEIIGEAVPQGSTKAIPFHRPCPKCTTAKPCGRSRMCVGGREIGASVMHDNRDELGAWRSAIAREVRRHLDDLATGKAAALDPMDAAWSRQRPAAAAGSVTLGVRFVLERPQGHYTARGALSRDGEAHPEPWRKPDVDKLERAVLDALNEAEVYTDDAQVATLVAVKDWALRGEPAKAQIVIAPGRKLVEVAQAVDRLIVRPGTGSLFG